MENKLIVGIHPDPQQLREKFDSYTRKYEIGHWTHGGSGGALHILDDPRIPHSQGRFGCILLEQDSRLGQTERSIRRGVREWFGKGYYGNPRALLQLLADQAFEEDLLLQQGMFYLRVATPLSSTNSATDARRMSPLLVIELVSGFHFDTGYGPSGDIRRIRIVDWNELIRSLPWGDWTLALFRK